MSNLSFVFQGKVYQAVEGELIVAQYDPAFGRWLTLTTADYEFHATQVDVQEDKLIYKIDKVTYFSDDCFNNVYREAIELSNESAPDLSKLKKTELIKVAECMGLQVSAKMTKKELLNLIEGLGELEC